MAAAQSGVPVEDVAAAEETGKSVTAPALPQGTARKALWYALNAVPNAFLSAAQQEDVNKAQGENPWSWKSFAGGGQAWLQGLEGKRQTTGEQLLASEGMKPGLGRNLVGGVLEASLTPAFGPIGEVGERVAGIGARIANPLLERIAGSAVAGGIYGTGEALAQGAQGWNIPKTAAENAALFAGLAMIPTSLVQALRGYAAKASGEAAEGVSAEVTPSEAVTVPEAPAVPPITPSNADVGGVSEGAVPSKEYPEVPVTPLENAPGEAQEQAVTSVQKVLDFWRPYYEKVNQMAYERPGTLWGRPVDLKAMLKTIQQDHPEYTLQDFTHDAEIVIKEFTPKDSQGNIAEFGPARMPKDNVIFPKNPMGMEQHFSLFNLHAPNEFASVLRGYAAKASGEAAEGVSAEPAPTTSPEVVNNLRKAVTPTTERTPEQLDKVRDLLRNKDTKPNVARAVLYKYPELQGEFPDLAPKQVGTAEQAPAKTGETPVDNRMKSAMRIKATEIGQAGRDKLVELAQQQKQGITKLGAGLDPDILQAYAQIGAEKILNGTLDFSDWSASMLGDFGDLIRPYLEPIWTESLKQYNDAKSSLLGTQNEFKDFKSVLTDPLNLQMKDNASKSTESWRYDVVGKKGEQITLGHRTATQAAEAAPNDMEAITVYRWLHGDKNLIQEYLDNPAEALDQKIPDAASKGMTWRQAIAGAKNLADNPTPEATTAYKMLDKAYSEHGAYGKFLGILKSTHDDYMNVLYREKDSARTAGTAHGRAREYDNPLESLLDPKARVEPITARANTLYDSYNESMARAGTRRELLNETADMGLGLWSNKPVFGTEDTGIANSEGKHLYLPTEYARGLKAITEPDTLRKVDLVRNIQKFQNTVRIYNFAMSGFHYINTLFAALNESKYGFDILTHPKLIHQLFTDNDFLNAQELHFVRASGTTDALYKNQDIVTNLVQDNSLLSKIERPGLLNKSNKLLFGKIIRFAKIADWTIKVASHVTPDMDNAESTQLERDVARQVNAAFGGRNWEALGTTPFWRGVFRLAFLAPDYTVSNVYDMPLNAVKGGTLGSLARQNLVTSAVGGIMLAQVFNYLFTGHSTLQNPRGHEADIQIAPGVFFSPFRGALGDMIYMAEYIGEEGPISGAGKFAQSKLSPLTRGLVGWATNVAYGNHPIANPKDPLWQQTVASLEYFGKEATPFSTSSVSTYVFPNSSLADIIRGAIQGNLGQQVNPQITPAGIVATATGIGRYAYIPSDYTQGESSFEKAVDNAYYQQTPTMLESSGTMAQIQLRDAVRQRIQQDPTNAQAIADQAVQQGLVTKKGESRFLKDSKMDTLQRKWSYLSAVTKARLLPLASPSEQAQLDTLQLTKPLRTAIHTRLRTSGRTKAH
jgi:hypothetical protein